MMKPNFGLVCMSIIVLVMLMLNSCSTEKVNDPDDGLSAPLFDGGVGGDDEENDWPEGDDTNNSGDGNNEPPIPFSIDQQATNANGPITYQVQSLPSPPLGNQLWLFESTLNDVSHIASFTYIPGAVGGPGSMPTKVGLEWTLEENGVVLATYSELIDAYETSDFSFSTSGPGLFYVKFNVIDGDTQIFIEDYYWDFQVDIIP